MSSFTPPVPTLDLIQSNQITEGQHYDFKRSLDLADRKAKCDFINDVVAFLNAGPAHLIIGVVEKKGQFERVVPLKGDRDAIRRQFVSTIQDNIDPKPLGIRVGFIDAEDGFLVDVQIPEHRMRPYQNRITGAFYVRTDAQNTPIPRDYLYTMFTPWERVEEAVLTLMAREDRAIEDRDIMQKNGVTLHIAIVPLEHFEPSRTPFDPGRGILKTMRYYHGGGGGVFKGCDGGYEVKESTFDEGRLISRFFIGDDWLAHSYVAHPFSADASGRLTLPEFKQALGQHLADIALVLEDSGIQGPFCILLAVRNLQGNPKVAWAFPDANSRALPRGYRAERLDDPEMIARFYDMLRGASVFGLS
jgi:hypothetical protein